MYCSSFLLGEKASLKLRGIVTANEWARLEGTDVDEALAAGKTRMNNIRLLESDTSRS